MSQKWDDKSRYSRFLRLCPFDRLFPTLNPVEELEIKHILKINHVGLRVRSLEAAQRFYESLGFELIAGPMGPEPAAILEHPSGVNINLILNASADTPRTNLLMDVAAKHTGYTHMALEVTDLRAVESEILAAGIEITETVRLTSGAEFFFVRDPDDNVLEFHQPAHSLTSNLGDNQ